MLPLAVALAITQLKVAILISLALVLKAGDKVIVCLPNTKDWLRTISGNDRKGFRFVLDWSWFRIFLITSDYQLSLFSLKEFQK